MLHLARVSCPIKVVAVGARFLYTVDVLLGFKLYPYSHAGEEYPTRTYFVSTNSCLWQDNLNNNQIQVLSIECRIQSPKCRLQSSKGAASIHPKDHKLCRHHVPIQEYRVIAPCDSQKWCQAFVTSSRCGRMFLSTSRTVLFHFDVIRWLSTLNLSVK